MTMTDAQMDKIRYMRIMGEMAGALGVVAIVGDPKTINIKGIKGILKRYREEFNDLLPDQIDGG